ncbi:hypothetical protein QQF64_019991 [Cirrhinus molitorella]|uniref:Uncharacterized protein n=1 Tax=Cirrhinus molitorella TaxID=172907 RepID=A0ABR3LIF3_9TELE
MDSRSRNVIVLFAQRRVKEEIWWRSKDSPICKTEGIRFAEMLPQLMNNINSFIHLCLQISITIIHIKRFSVTVSDASLPLGVIAGACAAVFVLVVTGMCVWRWCWYCSRGHEKANVNDVL